MSKPDRSVVFAVPDAPAPANLKEPTPADRHTRYLNIRLDNAKFKEIKKAALDLDMDLARYIVHLHDTAHGGG